MSDAPSDIHTALQALDDALGRLENRHQAQKQAWADKGRALDELNVVCAHLRADVSGLKKELAAQMAAGTKAGQQIEAALAQIDAVLEESHG